MALARSGSGRDVKISARTKDKIEEQNLLALANMMASEDTDRTSLAEHGEVLTSSIQRRRRLAGKVGRMGT